jgi:dolichyl-phosphate-mannose-protein mannosyltransferase
MFLWLRELELPPREAAAGTALLALNPLFLDLSYTFLTDVLFLALFLLACLFTWRGLRTRRNGALAAGSVLASLAYLSRQIGLAPTAVAALWLLRRRAKPLSWASVLALPMLTFAAHQYWLFHVNGLTHGIVLHYSESAARWSGPLWPTIKDAGVRFLEAFQYLSWFIAPAAAAVALGASRRKRAALAWSAAGAALLAAALLVKGPIPELGGDQITRQGLGLVKATNGWAQKQSGWFGSGPLWLAVNAAAVAGGLALAVSAADSVREPAMAFLGLSSWLAFTPLWLGVSFYDRYFLLLLPWAISACAAAWARSRTASTWAGAVLLGALGLAGVRDCLSWNAALWEAGRQAAQRGVDPALLIGGLSYDGAHWGHKNMAVLKAQKPVEKIRPFEWMDGVPFRGIISFDPEPPGPSLQPLLSVAYRTPFSGAGGRMFVYLRP